IVQAVINTLRIESVMDSSRVSGALNLAVGFNPLSLPKTFAICDRSFFALEGRWILAGGASHRVRATNSLRPGRGAGRDRIRRNSSGSGSGPAPLPGRKGNNDGLSGGFTTD